MNANGRTAARGARAAADPRERPLRIGIDGLELEGKRRGIGRYVFEICRELDAALPEARFHVYSRHPVEMPVDSPRWIARAEPSALARRLSGTLWLKARCGALCAGDRLDVFWGGAVFLPRLPREVRTVMTVHDLNYKLAPETMKAGYPWAFRLLFRRDLRRADVVSAVSAGTAQRMRQLLGHRDTQVVRPGVNALFGPRPRQQVAARLRDYALDDPYILSVATREPRKNLELLLRTFAGMKERGLVPAHRLVLVGDKGWNNRRISRLIERDGGRHFLPLGYVPEADLPLLYGGADAFVFPSVYEGFGSPVYEARACGTPIVTTDIPELHESGGERAVYIEPTEAGLRAGILAALAKGRSGGREQLGTWREAADALAAIFADARAPLAGQAGA